MTLIVGDLLSMALITLIGFAAHGEAESAIGPRMAVLFVPLSASWFLLAGALGLFRPGTVADPRQLWRPGLAAIFAAALAALVRGFLLEAPVLPIFGAVLAGVLAPVMILWRALYFVWNRRRS